MWPGKLIFSGYILKQTPDMTDYDAFVDKVGVLGKFHP